MIIMRKGIGKPVLFFIPPIDLIRLRHSLYGRAGSRIRFKSGCRKFWREKEGKSVFDYTSERWKKKRQKILRRDNYQCQECKRYGRNKQAIIVHHIKHVDEYPELAYIDSNLQSLCEACHNKMHPEKAKVAIRARR